MRGYRVRSGQLGRSEAFLVSGFDRKPEIAMMARKVADALRASGLIAGQVDLQEGWLGMFNRPSYVLGGVS